MGRRTDLRRKGQTSSYRRALYRNLVTDLLGYEKILTTEARARTKTAPQSVMTIPDEAAASYAEATPAERTWASIRPRGLY